MNSPIDTEVTPAIFRQYPDKSIVVLFPTIPADCRGAFVSSYMHVGQHGAADYSIVMQQTVPIKDAKEIEGLRSMLCNRYGYNIKVYSRRQPAHRVTFEKAYAEATATVKEVL